MYKNLISIISSILITVISHLPIACASLKAKINPVYEYTVNQGLENRLAIKLSEKLGPDLENNDKAFIDIISSYSLELQIASINSDILNNNHISEKELENTRATLSRIVNPEEIYAVLANGTGPDPEGILTAEVFSFYKLLRDNNVSNDNIELLVYNEYNRNLFETYIYNSFFKNNRRLNTIKDGKRTLSTVDPFELLPTSEDQLEIDNIASKENFLNSIKNLPSDYNDTIYIVYSTHGGIYHSIYHNDGKGGYVEFLNGAVTDIELNLAISNLKYKKMVIIQNSSNAAVLLRNLNKPNRIRNVLAIAATDEGESANAVFTLAFVDDYREDTNRPIKDIIKIEEKIWQGGNAHPQIFCFDNQGKKEQGEKCPWYNTPLF